MTLVSSLALINKLHGIKHGTIDLNLWRENVIGVNDEELEYDVIWSASSVRCHYSSDGEFDY